MESLVGSVSSVSGNRSYLSSFLKSSFIVAGCAVEILTKAGVIALKPTIVDMRTLAEVLNVASSVQYPLFTLV